MLFDFGQVIVSLNKQRCVDALYKVGCGAIAGYVDEHRSEDLFHEIELGGSTERFCEEARRQSASTTSDEDIIWAWNELLTGIPLEKLKLIKHLKQDLGYKTALLSNTNWMHWNKSVEDFFCVPGYGVEDCFDYVFLSCELGIVKPDPRIYQHVIETTGVQAEDILFFDDSARNCEGARRCGIHAIHDPEGNDWMNNPLLTSSISGTVACIGNFDGVHSGHRYILSRLKEVAKEKSMKPLVITFDHHPRELFDENFTPAFLTTLDEKVTLLRREVEDVLVMPFTRDFAQITAYDFMKDYLRDEMGVKVLLLGYDNRFGKRNNTEDFNTYREYGEQLGIEVLLANPVDVDGVRVSSSQVRHAVAAGRMEEASISLGRPYSITGTVIEGHHEGRRIGFPTANILPPAGKLIPPRGVYATQVRINNHLYRAMTNIGVRPTYHDNSMDTITIETNVFDFIGDIYGDIISVEFLRKVRDEQQFASPEELRQQIEKDKQTILK